MQKILASCEICASNLIKLGNLYLVRNMIEEAIQMYEQALALEPTCIMINYSLGLAYYKG
jgi:tetratricopeptide (TPR) repeat protein